MARDWRDIRAEAVASGRLDPQRVEAALKEIEELVRAHDAADGGSTR